MKYGFGIDLGGTTVKIAYFDEEGTMLEKWEIPTVTADGGSRILPDIAASIRAFLDAHSINETAVLGLGIRHRSNHAKQIGFFLCKFLNSRPANAGNQYADGFSLGLQHLFHLYNCANGIQIVQTRVIHSNIPLGNQ